jgi:hypothetical protein
MIKRNSFLKEYDKVRKEYEEDKLFELQEYSRVTEDDLFNLALIRWLKLKCQEKDKLPNINCKICLRKNAKNFNCCLKELLNEIEIC